MAFASKKPTRRIIVVVVPPVDELDLVGPLQVFNSVNRLAKKTLYHIEVVTNADRLRARSFAGAGPTAAAACGTRMLTDPIPASDAAPARTDLLDKPSLMGPSFSCWCVGPSLAQ